MKGALQAFASLAITAYSAETDIGPWTYSPTDLVTDTELYNYGGIIWKVRVTTAHDLDAGVEYLRLRHELTAPIQATDEITFEIAFTTENDPWTNKQIIAEDGAVCKMVKNTQDDFWTGTSEDKYYNCTSNTTCVNLVKADGDNAFSANADGQQNDWENPYDDDDEDNPFCTPHSTDPDNFACEKIICIQQRPMVTGDDKDFSFLPSGKTAETADKMYIGPGRAMLGMNVSGVSSADFMQVLGNFQGTTGASIEVSVYQGAITNIATAFGAAFALLAFF